jgi:DNA mismatch endonuclease (patch repair protein)
MRAIRSTGNRTETALRKALHGMGLRYRVYKGALPGRPDIVFPREKVTVFVDGDYWHARLLREQGPTVFRATLRTPTWEYWFNKFQRRVVRDDWITADLENSGWLVLRFWESDIKHDWLPAAKKIASAVRKRRVTLRRRAQSGRQKHRTVVA